MYAILSIVAVGFACCILHFAFLPTPLTSSTIAMSVRVVARIRPLLKHELDKDTIVTAESTSDESSKSLPTIVRIPNPKTESESFSFQFSSVYEQEATQQEVFDAESRSHAGYHADAKTDSASSISNRKASIQWLVRASHASTPTTQMIDTL